MDISRCLRDVILEAIKSRGITEKQCADACGLSNGFFADWKAERVKCPSFDKVFKMCKYLGVSMDSLALEHPTPICAVEGSAHSVDEERLLERFGHLDDDGRELVLAYALTQLQRVKTEKGTGVEQVS